MIELTPDTYQNKDGETKHLFRCKVISAPIPKSPPAKAPSPAAGGDVVALDDEIPF